MKAHGAFFQMVRYAAILAAFVVPTTTRAGVVIHEIFYNAPGDLEDLQWIELYNDGDAPVDLSGWKLDGGSVFVFPEATRMEAHQYVVVALNPDRFTEFYDGGAIGPLKRPLKRGGERIELADTAGRRIDVARYKDTDPWPVSPDGYTASLERICPSAPGDVPENWAASPLSAVDTKPNGTPGRQNGCHSGTLPPTIEIVSGTPDDLAPEQPLRVEAEVQGERLREVALLYRIVAAGVEGQDTVLPMTRDSVTQRFHSTIPGQKSGALIRYRIEALSEDGARRLYPAEHDLRPTFSAYVHDKWESASIPLGLILRGGPDRPNASNSEPPRRGDPRRFGRGPAPNFGGFGPRAPAQPRPPRGASAFVHVDPRTGKTTLFDHIHIVARNNDRGFKLLFHKDRSWDGMRSINLVFEGSEWSLLAEALAFDLYRRAGNPAPLTEFVRVWVDGRMAGYHLAIERINKSFLSRNKVAKDGNLYKIQWTGRDIVGQHEKRTHTQQGHEDVVSIADRLEKTSGEEQWEVIQESFNVQEVATYFAVNMVLSHWDGFFNNYFPYHDTENGKWEMYPWDQDKTWGYYDGLPDDQVFFDMPLTYGMAGDRPPGSSGGGDRGGRFGRGRPMWWREGGYFSRPLLASPQFRKVFLDRTREILETIYTEETYFPLIEEMAERLEEDVRIRAEATGRTAEEGTRELTRNVDLLKTHLTKRRQFLLGQQELGGTQAARPREPGEEPQTPPTMLPGVEPVILVPAGSRWKYLDTGVSPGPDWTQLDFQDDAWREGPAQLGYGDGDEKTRINDARDNYPTYYFRQRFEVKDPSKLKPLVIRLIRDDGAVVYINGREVLRDNMPEGSVDHGTYAVDSMSSENEFYVHELAAERLVAGTNIIAVEVHQANANSSDVSLDVELREKVPGVDVLGAPPGERRSPFGRGRGGGPEQGGAGPRSGATEEPNALEREPRGPTPRASGLGSLPERNRELVEQFDKDADGDLDRAERQEARAFLETDRGGRGRPSGFGIFRRGRSDASRPGPRVEPSEVRTYPDATLYDPGVLRTLFLEFEYPDWEAELEAFHHTDVEVPATLLVDGKTFLNVGVKFRGTGSFNETSTGQKRSFKLKLDNVEKEQALYGYTTLNLNNAFHDPGFMSSVLYSRIARRHVPAPKVNYVKVVVNGESWGVYINAQEFDKQFLKESFASSDGTRWKVPANRYGTPALSYLGEDVELYKPQYELKTKQSDDAWRSLVALCRTLNEIPPDGLVAALDPILDIDGALWFLAIENVLCNNDGYWSKGSDFNLFRDKNGKFHVIIHDTNETFAPVEVDGGGFRSRTRTLALDPLVAIDEAGKPLRRKLLAVPALRERYLEHVRTLAERSLDWTELGPLVESCRALIDTEVRQDTRKLYSTEEYESTVASEAAVSAPPAEDSRAAPGRNPSLSLRAFAEQRREYLLHHPEIQKPSSTGVATASGDVDPPAASPPASSASGTEFGGALPSGTTVWTASDSPVHVTRTIVVPPGATLQIEPGVTVHFDQGSGIEVNGRLRIEGSESQHVRLTRGPTATGTWNGIRCVRTSQDNRLVFVDMEWSDGGGAHIRADDSVVRLDHVTWEHVNPRRQIVDLRGATSFEISSCVFPTLGSAEHVHYQGHVPEGGFAILRGNLFGGNTGYNDVIDMSTAKAPGPILQVIGNVFTAGGDDQLDLDGTDAWIEGNVFHGAHSVDGSGNPGLSASISGGIRDGKIPTFYVVRNYFYDLDRIALVKEGAFATFVHNTAVNITRGGIAFFEPDRRDFGRSASLGKGALLDGNIFWNVVEPLQYVSHGGDAAQITVRNSIIQGPDVYPGSGNSNVDPRLRNTNTITDAAVDLALMPDSPARGAGPNGVDMGAAIPGGASVSGVPASPTALRAAALTVGGPQYVAYRYRLNDAAWSDEIPIDRPIQLSDLADGDYTVHVIAKNAAGVWQAESHATASTEWTIRTARHDGPEA